MLGYLAIAALIPFAFGYPIYRLVVGYTALDAGRDLRRRAAPVVRRALA